jgi:pimeloyl-ACP methyl ester carboxylesterase
MPTDSADLLRQLKPDAVIETLPNVAHFGPLQSPKVFVERVENFLSRLS